MTAAEVGFALVVALCTGYGWGRRRAGTAAPTWQRRTSRTALGMVAANLVVLVIARRIQQKLLVALALPAAVGIFGHRSPPRRRPAARRRSRR